MKAKFTKYGPKYDYTGAHVVYQYGPRQLLGTIREVYRDEFCFTRCKVQHFNGEWWPWNPALSVLEILERT